MTAFLLPRERMQVRIIAFAVYVRIDWRVFVDLQLHTSADWSFR